MNLTKGEFASTLIIAAFFFACTTGLIGYMQGRADGERASRECPAPHRCCEKRDCSAPAKKDCCPAPDPDIKPKPAPLVPRPAPKKKGDLGELPPEI